VGRPAEGITSLAFRGEQTCFTLRVLSPLLVVVVMTQEFLHGKATRHDRVGDKRGTHLGSAAVSPEPAPSLLRATGVPGTRSQP